MWVVLTLGVGRRGSLTVLKERIVTAIIMVILISASIIFLPMLWLAALFAGFILVAAWEWAALAGFHSSINKFFLTAFIALLMAAVIEYAQLFEVVVLWARVQDILGLSGLWWAIALLWVKTYPASAIIWQSTAMRVLMGCLTLVPTWLALVYLRMQEHGIILMFILMALVAAADIGAYFSGKAWGKSKLAPMVSPGKSWAGFWGGIACSGVFSTVIWLLFGREQYSLLVLLAIALATTLASVLGDLLESMVKRQQGVKDSGRILPGHGGMMDRMDSMTAAAPVFALCLMLAGW